MAQATISYLPVCNGDCSLTRLKDGTTIVLDLNHRNDPCDPKEKKPYDVQAHLQRAARKDDEGRRHHDVLGVTHPDQDHCRGFQKIFFCGDPRDFDAKEDADKIIADELWFSPRIFSKYEKHANLCDDAKTFKREANRRIRLHEDKSTRRDDAGNRIRILGHTDDPRFECLEHLITGAGEVLDQVNGQTRDDYEIFVHAPFSHDTDSKDADRNGTSIVFQARFAEGGMKRSGLAFFGGDVHCDVMAKIRDRSDDEDLEYDLLLAPHHSSWTFFSNESTEKGEANEKVLEFLDMRRDGALVISSSRTRKEAKKDVLPPHERALKEYRKKVGDESVFITQEHPDEGDPKPIEFAITANGPQRRETSTTSAVVSSSSIMSAVTAPRTYG